MGSYNLVDFTYIVVPKCVGLSCQIRKMWLIFSTLFDSLLLDDHSVNWSRHETVVFMRFELQFLSRAGSSSL